MRASRRVSRRVMNLANVILSLVAAALLVYLMYALLRPEKF
jgi:K+-transporting ATPase KdpF subunit